MELKNIFALLAVAIFYTPSYALDLNAARCTVQVSGDPQANEMKYDFARGHFYFGNPMYSAGVAKTDTEVLVSVTRISDKIRVNSYLIPNSDGTISIAQSIDSDYRKKEIVVQCTGIK